MVGGGNSGGNNSGMKIIDLKRQVVSIFICFVSRYLRLWPSWPVQNKHRIRNVIASSFQTPNQGNRLLIFKLEGYYPYIDGSRRIDN